MTAKNFLTRTQLPALIERAQKYADENAANWEAHDGLKQTAVHEYIPEIVNRWSRAVDKYELIECGLSKDEFEAALLNGAKNWRQYSEGACSLICTEDVIHRVGEPVFSTSFESEEDKDDARFNATWTMQATALRHAGACICRAYADLRAERRQFYVIRTSRHARKYGGYNETYVVFEYQTDTEFLGTRAGMCYCTEFKLCTSYSRGIEHETIAALVKAGCLPREVLTRAGHFDAANYGQSSDLCAYCTVNALPLSAH